MIIDIGSGHKPYPKADILLEYRLADNSERWYKDLITDRPTVIYDGQTFPFKDNSFSFSSCRHVLEHVDNPKQFLNEIERISKSGYIETPSELAELIFTPFDKHKWIIFNKNGKIIIRKKTIDNTSKLGTLFDYLCENEKNFEDNFYWKRRKMFFVEYKWKNNIDFEVLPSSPSTLFDLYDKSTLQLITQKNRLVNKKTLIKKTNIKHVYGFLEKNLICPTCSGNLKFLPNNFFCKVCNCNYAIRNNVIKMYKER